MSNTVRHAAFQSEFVIPRHVDVWLPSGYESAPEQRYPVIYMHDGENLFDTADGNFGVTWNVGPVMEQLAAAGETPFAIVVGMWSTPQRYSEYRPTRPFDFVSPRTRERMLASTGGSLLSDAYLTFIVTELKPFIDATYRTLPDRQHTSIMGSSMGGLISLYGICEYPEVFGGSGCVSSHWPAVEGVILPYLRERLPDPDTHRIYFDYGTHTIDNMYLPEQLEVDKLMVEKSYVEGSQWVSRCFPGDAHFERDWAGRVEIPLRFLLARA